MRFAQYAKHPIAVPELLEKVAMDHRAVCFDHGIVFYHPVSDPEKVFDSDQGQGRSVLSYRSVDSAKCVTEQF